MDEKIYQKILDLTIGYVPEDFEKIVFYIAYTDGGYEIKYYVKDNKQYIDCYNIESVNDDELVDLFDDIDKVISKERKKLDKDNVWSIMTLVISADGKFNAYFSYDDIVDNEVENFKKWKSKYLK